MTAERRYPDEPNGPFPTPPRTVTDREGREIELRPYDGEFDALVEMYVDFDPADRAQGIPPVGEGRVRDWLDLLLDGYNVLAWHGDDVVGHATLVPDREPGADAAEPPHELAIFVHQDYQGAGIGTALVESLLGHGADAGVERVWLTVERWNKPAVGLYRSVGFETCDAESFELEMAIRLAGGEE